MIYILFYCFSWESKVEHNIGIGEERRRRTRTLLIVSLCAFLFVSLTTLSLSLSLSHCTIKFCFKPLITRYWRKLLDLLNNSTEGTCLSFIVQTHQPKKKKKNKTKTGKIHGEQNLFSVVDCFLTSLDVSQPWSSVFVSLMITCGSSSSSFGSFHVLS